MDALVASTPALADLDLSAPLWHHITPTALSGLLEDRGRLGFLEELQRRGLARSHCLALADALGDAVREGRLPPVIELQREFDEAARCMPQPVRRLLVDNVDPHSVDLGDLLAALGRTDEASWNAAREGDVMQADGVLSPRACAILRGAVDSDRRREADSVDGGPEHQLNLSREALQLLIGSEEAGRLWSLCSRYRARSTVAVMDGEARGEGGGQPLTSTQVAELRARASEQRAEAIALKRSGDASGAMTKLREAKAAEELAAGAVVLEGSTASTEGGRSSATTAPVDGVATAAVDGVATAAVDGVAQLREMFVRRYSISTRPWIPFHPDRYEVTCNVALSDDANHSGGRLLGVFEGQVQQIPRREGTATVHSSKLLHAVSRMDNGIRYSLIIFWDRSIPARPSRWAPQSGSAESRTV